MKKLLFFFVLFPLTIFAQYYVGKLATYASQDFYSLAPSGKFITSDGSIFVYSSTLKKIKADGSADTSFGNNGTVTNILPVVSGLRTAITVNNQYIFLNSDKKIARYSLNGVLDTTFGNNGIVTLPKNIWKMVANDDSSLLIIMNTSKINKILPNGDLSTSFEINNVGDFYIADQNQIYTTYYHNTTTNPVPKILSKYSLDGVKDLSFGNAGSISYFDQLLVNIKNGEFYFMNNNQLTRYTNGGVVDVNFGTSGVITYTFPLVSKVLSDSNNKILFFGGSQGYGSNLSSVFRLENNGALDHTFNNGSFVYSEVGSGMITNVLLLDDHNYICETSKRISLNSTIYGTAKYVRTTNQSILSTQEHVSLNKNVLIYPNPSSDIIHIKINNEKIEKVKIFSMSGNLVLVDYTNEIAVKSLPAGKYLLEITTDKQIYRDHILKK